MTFTCNKADISFLDKASVKVVNTVDLAATPEQIFEIFESGPAWTEWFDGISEVEWTSNKPYGVGTTRMVRLGALKVWEHFFHWEDNKSFSFYFTETSLPFVQTLVEDYRLEPIDDNNTRFTYTVAYDPAFPLRLLGPLGRAALKRKFTLAAKSLVRYVENKSYKTT